jgi:hypothetical protein
MPRPNTMTHASELSAPTIMENRLDLKNEVGAATAAVPGVVVSVSLMGVFLIFKILYNDSICNSRRNNVVFHPSPHAICH